jgi:hypothetical protein
MLFFHPETARQGSHEFDMLEREKKRTGENGPERFESVAPFTSDLNRTFRILFTSLQSVEAAC